MSQIKISCEDNMDLMARYKDDYFDIAIVDPPYGISKNMQGSKQFGQQMKGQDWNDAIPDEDYFKELFRVSKNQIIWGANYYANYLPNERDWLVWDKKQGDLGFSMHELAWTSFGKVPKIYRQRADRKNRWHPCQKPVGLYEYILHKYAKEGDIILDTHLGSGTIAKACHNLGYDLVACEIDKTYFDQAIADLEEHKKQILLF